VAIPVSVKDRVANPAVAPLSPTGAGSSLSGIVGRTAKTPFRILSPFLKDNPQSDHGLDAKAVIIGWGPNKNQSETLTFFI
jgi:hypothetical protein